MLIGLKTTKIWDELWQTKPAFGTKQRTHTSKKLKREIIRRAKKAISLMEDLRNRLRRKATNYEKTEGRNPGSHYYRANRIKKPKKYVIEYIREIVL